jgi:hypothetical protein
MPTLTAVGVSGMIGVLVGYLINELIGGRRSSIGVHRSDGKLLPFWSGFIFFSLVVFITGLGTALTSTLLTNAFSGLGALAIATLGVALFLSVNSYSRG